MPRHVLIGATVAWLGLVVLGQGALIQYALTPGREGHTPTSWPAASPLDRAPGRYTLVMAAHPHCPCTRASLSELAQIVGRCDGRLSVRVLFVQPARFADDWVKADLWRATASIPCAKAILDPGGREAMRFGAFTSGQAALYDAAGRLAFSGGITSARGEIGANAGESAIVALVARGVPSASWTPVYGCPLEDPRTGQTGARKDPSCPDS